jgi:hypothetical protein
VCVDGIIVLLLSLDLAAGGSNAPAPVIVHGSPYKFQVSASLMAPKEKERQIRSKYDIELAAMDTADPNNWEFQSTNRQRSLYGHLYSELDLVGKTKDTNLIFETKLNKLSPGGNFRVFISKIRKERIAAKNSILANTDMTRVHVKSDVIFIRNEAGEVVEPVKEVRRAMLIVSPPKREGSSKQLLVDDDDGEGEAVAGAGEEDAVVAHTPSRFSVHSGQEAVPKGEDDNEGDENADDVSCTGRELLESLTRAVAKHQEIMIQDELSGENGLRQGGNDKESIEKTDDRAVSPLPSIAAGPSLDATPPPPKELSTSPQVTHRRAGLNISKTGEPAALPVKHVMTEAAARRLSVTGTFASKLRDFHPADAVGTLSSSSSELKPSEIVAQSSRKRGSMMITNSAMSKSTPLLPSALLAVAQHKEEQEKHKGKGKKHTEKSGDKHGGKHGDKHGDKAAEGRKGAAVQSHGGVQEHQQQPPGPIRPRPSSPDRLSQVSPIAMLGAGARPRSASPGAGSMFPPIGGAAAAAPAAAPHRPSVAVIRPSIFEKRAPKGPRDDGAEVVGFIPTPNQEKYVPCMQFLSRFNRKVFSLYCFCFVYCRFVKIVEEAVTRFDDAVKAVDKFSKMSRRESRRSIHESLRSNQVDSKLLAQIANEHSTSALMLQNQKSMEGVMEITLKQRAAEKNWVRKVSMAMDDSFINNDINTPMISVSRLSLKDADGPKLSVAERHVKSKKKSDVKVLAIKSFGPYPVEELVKFLRAFDSLPQKTVRLNAKSDDEGDGLSSLLDNMKAAARPGSPAGLHRIDEHEHEHEDGDHHDGEDDDENSQALSDDDWGDLDDILAAPAHEGGAADIGDERVAHLMKSLSYQHNSVSELASVASAAANAVKKAAAKSGKSKNKSGKISASATSKKLRFLQMQATGGSTDAGGSGKGSTSTSATNSSVPTASGGEETASPRPIAAPTDPAAGLTIDIATMSQRSTSSYASDEPYTNVSNITGARSPTNFSVASGVISPIKASTKSMKPAAALSSKESVGTHAPAHGYDDDGQIISKVRLSNLVKHKYFRRVPEWLYAVEKMLSRRQQQLLENSQASGGPSAPKPHGPIDDDWVGLHEIVVDMCPHMNPIERSECLRFLTLKSQNDHAAQIEHKRREAETAKQKALAARFSNMNSIFAFFDKQSTGKVQKFDILKVLKKTLANKAKDRDKDLSGELSLQRYGATAMMAGAEDDVLMKLIARLDDGVNSSWVFNEFVEIFENVFGY